MTAQRPAPPLPARLPRSVEGYAESQAPSQTPSQTQSRAHSRTHSTETTSVIDIVKGHDFILECGPKAMHVRASTLIDASPLFARILSDHYHESAQYRKPPGHRMAIRFTDDPDCWELLLRILHHCRTGIPSSLSSHRLLQFVELANKYDCLTPSLNSTIHRYITTNIRLHPESDGFNLCLVKAAFITSDAAAFSLTTRDWACSPFALDDESLGPLSLPRFLPRPLFALRARMISASMRTLRETCSERLSHFQNRAYHKAGHQRCTLCGKDSRVHNYQVPDACKGTKFIAARCDHDSRRRDFAALFRFASLFPPEHPSCRVGLWDNVDPLITSPYFIWTSVKTWCEGATRHDCDGRNCPLKVSEDPAWCRRLWIGVRAAAREVEGLSLENLERE